MTSFIGVNHILKDKHNPLRYVNLEQAILSHKLPNNLIDGIVELHELIPLVVLVGEDLLADVHLHVKEELE